MKLTIKQLNNIHQSYLATAWSRNQIFRTYSIVWFFNYQSVTNLTKQATIVTAYLRFNMNNHLLYSHVDRNYMHPTYYQPNPYHQSVLNRLTNKTAQRQQIKQTGSLVTFNRWIKQDIDLLPISFTVASTLCPLLEESIVNNVYSLSKRGHLIIGLSSNGIFLGSEHVR